MAIGNEDKKLTATEKGKGKAPVQEDMDGSNGTSEPLKDKDGKVVKDGKDADKPEEGTLSHSGKRLTNLDDIVVKLRLTYA